MELSEFCSSCLEKSKERAGMSTVMVEQFLNAALQRAVARAGSNPIKGCKGFCAPVSYATFKAIHRMLVCRLPVPAPGQGISMDRYGKPVYATGARGGRKKWVFEVTVTEVTADICSDCAWSNRCRGVRDSEKVTSGPIFHHTDGAMGCIATPLKFTLEEHAPYGGIRVDRMLVQHDYFILDVGGEFRGMGQSRKRTPESASLNRVLLCQHANRLRARGAKFTPEQVATIDFYLSALLSTLPPMDTSDDEEGEDADDDGATGTAMSSPAAPPMC